MRMILMLFVLCGTVLTADATHGAARDGSGWTAGAVAVFCCDFGHYPPVRNVQISYELCDVSIFADRRPHLRMLVPEKSRFRMEFSLPERPQAALLEVVHLGSTDEKGEAISPVTISANGKTVVEDFNVGKAEYTETRWPVGDKLQAGRNRIEWLAGEINTHYWLRRATLYIRFDHEVSVSFPVQQAEHALFWEGRFSQCSYNALATVLDHFYGIQPWTDDREEFEQREFVTALKKFKLGGYFGWAPWTSYMVQSGAIRWNGHLVSELKAERFALRTKEIPKPKDGKMIVRYQPGEKAALTKELMARLNTGPVIIWTPYAAALDQDRRPWRHVRNVDANTDAVDFRPHMTHSVVINLEAEKVKVYDNSRPGGIWVVEAETVVATAAAMVGSVRIDRGGGHTLRGKGLPGVEDDQYNVVFWRESGDP